MANGGNRTPPESAGGPYRTPRMVSRLPGNQMLQALRRFAKTALHHLLQVESGRIHDHRVHRGPQRGDGALGVVLVTATLVGEDFRQRHGQTLFSQLRVAALRPRLVGGGEERRVGKECRCRRWTADYRVTRGRCWM